MFAPAFLIVWNDISSGTEAEYQRWHRVEHMPERLAIPGFQRGRRYTDLSGGNNRYLTMYEVDGVDIFSSPLYRQSLANPTPWTVSMSSAMPHFVRRVCCTTASEGTAIGGAVATFWLSAATPAQADAIVAALSATGEICAAHVACVDWQATGMRGDELQNRSAGATDTFDAVLIVEADRRARLEDLLPVLNTQIASGLGPDAVKHVQIYDLVLIQPPSHGI